MVAGALLGVGVINSSVADENDPAFALLYEPISSSDPIIRSGAILGLALAYAGTGKLEVLNSACLHPFTESARHVQSCCDGHSSQQQSHPCPQFADASMLRSSCYGKRHI